MKNKSLKPKSAKLIELHAKYLAVKSDYKNPARSQIIADYCAELSACGRKYYDDRLAAYAADHGSLYGEETMLEMIAEGKLNAADLAASVERHATELLAQDAAGRINEAAPANPEAN